MDEKSEKADENFTEALKRRNCGRSDERRNRTTSQSVAGLHSTSLKGALSPFLVNSSAEKSPAKAGSKKRQEPTGGSKRRNSKRKCQADVVSDEADLRVSVAEISRDLLNESEDILIEPVTKKNKTSLDSITEGNPIGIISNDSGNTIRSDLLNTLGEINSSLLAPRAPGIPTNNKPDIFQTVLSTLPAQEAIQPASHGFSTDLLTHPSIEDEDTPKRQAGGKDNVEKFIKKTTSRGFTYIFVQSASSNAATLPQNTPSNSVVTSQKNENTASKGVSPQKNKSPVKTKQNSQSEQESPTDDKSSELEHACPFHGCDKAYAVRSSLLRHFILFPTHKPQIKKESHTASKECDLFLPKDLTEYRRKARIRELFKRLSDEELKDLAFPRLVKLLSAWEFLEKKCEKGYPKRVLPSVVFREFEGLRIEVEDRLSTMASDERKKLHIQYMPGLNNGRNQDIACNKTTVTSSESTMIPIASTKHIEAVSVSDIITTATVSLVNDTCNNTSSTSTTIPVIPEPATNSTSVHVPVTLNSIDLNRVMTDKFVHIAPKPVQSQEETSSEVNETSKADTKDISLNLPYTYEPNGKVTYKLSGAKVAVNTNQSDFAVSETEFLKFLRRDLHDLQHLILETKDTNGKSFFKEFLMPLFQKNHAEQFVEFACNIALKYKVSQGQLKKYLRYNLGEKLKNVLGFNIFPPLDKLLPTLKKMKEDEEVKFGKENDKRVEKKTPKKMGKDRLKSAQIPPTSAPFTPESEETSDLLVDLHNELDDSVDFDPSSFMDMRPRQSASAVNKRQLLPAGIIPVSSETVVSNVQTNLTTHTHAGVSSFHTPISSYISSIPSNMQIPLANNLGTRTVQSHPVSVMQQQSMMTTPLSVQILPPQVPSPSISPAPRTSISSLQQSMQKSYTTTQSRHRSDSTQIVVQDNASRNHMSELQVPVSNPPRLLNTDIPMISSNRNLLSDNPLGYSSQTQCRYFGIAGNDIMPLFGRNTSALDREPSLTRPIPSTTPITTIMSSCVTALPPLQPTFFTRPSSMLSPTAFTPPQRLSMSSNSMGQSTSASPPGLFPPRTQNALHPQQFPHWFQ